MTTTSNHTSTTAERMQMTRDEYLARRSEAMSLFQPIDGGDTLNVGAITTLIDWAESDEQRREQRYASWGSWRQGLWGLATTASQNIRSMISTDRDKATEEVIEQGRNGVCGTAYCMAGQAVVQAGYALDYDDNLSEWDTGMMGVSAENCVWQEPTNETNRWGRPVMKDVGDPREISDVAQEILGLEEDEADEFFAGSNSIRTLKTLTNQFCARRGMDQPYEDFLVTGLDVDEFEEF